MQTLTLPKLRQRLDDLAAGLESPQLGELTQLRQLWEQTYKPGTMVSYHPIIEDRLQLAESNVAKR